MWGLSVIGGVFGLALLSVGAPAAAVPAFDDRTPVVGRDAGDILEARVVRRGVVVRGPRGGARVFTYRGRALPIVRRPAFVYPPGFAYRRWAVGAILPAALIAAPFVFLDYQALGLRPPPPGQVWVRHGPDVVLVDQRTRRVSEAAYGAIEEE